MASHNDKYRGPALKQSILYHYRHLEVSVMTIFTARSSDCPQDAGRSAAGEEPATPDGEERGPLEVPRLHTTG